jgi:hypothetical protein
MKNKHNDLFAGWAEADITPENSMVELSGQYYQRLSQGIHSRLKAVVLVLEQTGTISILISLDNVGVPEEFLNRLEGTIYRKFPELTTAKLIINATHTHCAPDLTGRLSWWDSSDQAIKSDVYSTILEGKIIEAIADAWNNRIPCGIANVLDYARIGHCRRAVYANNTAEMYGRTDRSDFTGMEGGEDSGVDLLFFFDEKKKPVGVIVNVACPSQVMEATYLISSDYFGALREKLKKEYGQQFITLCQVSAAGCQSPRDLVRNYKGEPDFWHADGVDVLAERLFQAIQRVYVRTPHTLQFQPLLYHSVDSLVLPIRKVSKKEWSTAKEELDRLLLIQEKEDAFADFCRIVHENEQIEKRPGPYDSKLHHFVLIKNQQAVIKRYEQQIESPGYSMKLHIIHLGNVVFAFNPFELFLDYGNRIKAQSGAEQTFVVQLANGIGGYLPTSKAEQLGGYGGLVINGQVGSQGGNRLVSETVSAIQQYGRRPSNV